MNPPMKKYSRLLLTASILLSACNLPVESAADTGVATAAALTVEAAIENNQAPLASPTAESTSGSAQEATPTYSQPSASFEDVTNCRTGPGVDYERVMQIPPGVSVEIVGFFPPNYWVVQTDAGPCWVAGEFVTPAGSVSAVPTVTAPPTPEGGLPQNVSLQKWDIFCNYATNEANVTVIWADKEGETGYRVIRNDVLITELPADTTQFKETITLLSGQTVGYSIVAYNAAGSTSSKTITLGC
jgi:uncharacterized protein YraI